jgi:hypothetical protein
MMKDERILNAAHYAFSADKAIQRFGISEGYVGTVFESN